MKYNNFLIVTLMLSISLGLQAYKLEVRNRSGHTIDVRAHFTALAFGGGWSSQKNIPNGSNAVIKGATGRCLNTERIGIGKSDPIQVRKSADADTGVWHNFAQKDKGLTACGNNHIVVKTIHGGTAFLFD